MNKFIAWTVCFLCAFSARADILVGLAGPFTGPDASFGQQFRLGAEMAVNDLNSHGGVLGQQLKLIEGDDQCDPKQAVAVANQLAGDKVAVVIGHFCSGSSIPASSVYAEENIVMISPGSTNPQLTEAGRPNVFRTCGRDDQQGEIAGAFIATHYPHARIAIIDDRQAYSEGLANEVRKQLHASGVTETLDDKLTPGEKDYAALVTKLKRAHIDFLYYGGYQAEAGLLVRQLHQQGMDHTPLMSGDAIVTRDFWSITGASGNGTLMTFPPDPALNAANTALVGRFQQQTGAPPEGYTLYTYGTVQAWAAAVQQAGTTETKAVETELHKANLPTVLGDLSFDAKGDVRAPGYVIYEWRDGIYKYLE